MEVQKNVVEEYAIISDKKWNNFTQKQVKQLKPFIYQFTCAFSDDFWDGFRSYRQKEQKKKHYLKLMSRKRKTRG